MNVCVCKCVKEAWEVLFNFFFFVTLMVLLAFLPDFDMCSVLSPGESALHSTRTAFNVYCFHIPQKLISRLSRHSQ